MSDGQFSEKPISSPGLSEATPFTAEIKYGLVPPVAAKVELDDLEKALLRSPALQREVNALMDKQMPRPLTCELLPSNTPLEARQFGAPLAHGIRRGSNLFVFVVIKIVGWYILFAGPCAIAMIGGACLTSEDGSKPVLWVFFGVHVLGTLAGIKMVFFERYKPPQSCWFCPRGIIWLTGAKIEHREWESVHEIYFRLHVRRPSIGLRIDDEIAWFTLSNPESISERASAVEAVASAAKMPAFLNHIAAGNTVRFGSWDIDRYSLRTHDNEIHWKHNAEIDVGDSVITIRDCNGQQIVFSIEQMAFPGLFVTLTRALIGFWRESLANRQRG